MSHDGFLVTSYIHCEPGIYMCVKMSLVHLPFQLSLCLTLMYHDLQPSREDLKFYVTCIGRLGCRDIPECGHVVRIALVMAFY